MSIKDMLHLMEEIKSENQKHVDLYLSEIKSENSDEEIRNVS